MKAAEVKFVAVLAVEPGRVEIVRTFDAAWHLSLELPTPVRVRFLAFVRKDDE